MNDEFCFLFFFIKVTMARIRFGEAGSSCKLRNVTPGGRQMCGLDVLCMRKAKLGRAYLMEMAWIAGH